MMNKPNPTHRISNDLAWQADRLLLDALTPAEQAEFAELLATDQGAREALADEVLLVQALSQLTAADFAPRELVTPAAAAAAPGLAPDKRIRWITLASSLVAASLLLAAVLASQGDLFDSTPASNSVAGGTGPVEQYAELASLWSQNRSAYESPVADAAGSDSLLDADLELRSRDDRDAGREFAPSWMFAALEAVEANPDAAASTEEDIQWQ